MRVLKQSLALILIALVLFLSAPRGERAKPIKLRVKQDQIQASAQQQLTETEKSIAKDLSSIARSADSIHRDAIAAYRQYQADQNSYSAPAVKVQIFLSVVGLLYVGTAFLQWRAIGRQADIAEDTLKETSRPWVYGDISIGSDLIYDTNGVSLTLQIVLRNTGHSVAKDVWPNLQMFLHVPRLKGDPVDVIAKQRKLSAEARDRPQNEPFGLRFSQDLILLS